MKTQNPKKIKIKNNQVLDQPPHTKRFAVKIGLRGGDFFAAFLPLPQRKIGL
jgi:hypothetical protein